MSQRRTPFSLAQNFALLKALGWAALWLRKEQARSWTFGMEAHLTPDLEAKLNALAAETGRATDQLVQDVMAGYFDELAQMRETLDRRYDDIKSGRVKPIDGEAFFENLRQRENKMRKRRSPR